MAYNKEELLKLPVSEKQELAEALWNSIDDELLPVTEDEILFAEERYQQHLKNYAIGYIPKYPVALLHSSILCLYSYSRPVPIVEIVLHLILFS